MTDAETDLIRGAGEKVSITDGAATNQKKTDQGALKQSNTINDSRLSSRGGLGGAASGSSSRAKIAERLAKANTIPKANKIEVGGVAFNRAGETSEEHKKITVVKHLPKSDEEILDKLIAKHTAHAVPMRKAQRDARTELQVLKKAW